MRRTGPVRRGAGGRGSEDRAGAMGGRGARERGPGRCDGEQGDQGVGLAPGATESRGTRGRGPVRWGAEGRGGGGPARCLRTRQQPYYFSDVIVQGGVFPLC